LLAGKKYQARFILNDITGNVAIAILVPGASDVRYLFFDILDACFPGRTCSKNNEQYEPKYFLHVIAEIFLSIL
jgi:hypothetical protein